MSITFGKAIAQARKSKSMSQKELAALIRRDDGDPISPQYLNDIEHDRRSPSSEFIVQQLAKVLSLEPDYLYFLAGVIPADLLDRTVTPEQVQKAMVLFRETLKGRGKKAA